MLENTIAPILLAIATLAFFLLSSLEKHGSDECRQGLIRFFESPKLGGSISPFVSMIHESFDILFGNISKKQFIFRSFVATTACFILVTFGWYIFRTEDCVSFFQDGFLLGISVLFSAALLFNFIPDVVALIETWVIVGSMKKKIESGQYVLFWLVALIFIDTFLTFGIGFFVIYLFSLASGIEVWSLFTRAVYFEPLNDRSYSIGIFLYTTFLTTIWAWLCGIAVIISVFIDKTSRIIGLTGRMYQKENPYAALKTLIAIILGVPLALIAPSLIAKLPL